MPYTRFDNNSQISFKLLNPSAQCFWCTAKLARNGHCGSPLCRIFAALDKDEPLVDGFQVSKYFSFGYSLRKLGLRETRGGSKCVLAWMNTKPRKACSNNAYSKPWKNTAMSSFAMARYRGRKPPMPKSWTANA